MTGFKPSLKTELLPLLLIAVAFLIGIYIQLYGPAQMPIHWDIAGNVDGFASRTFAAWFVPAIMFGLYLVLLFVPRLDPKIDQYKNFAGAYLAIRNVIIAFMLALYVITSWAGFGHPVDISKAMPIGVGILFIVIGSYIGSVRQNWFMGVRNPWTLSDEEVWTKANKLMSPVMVVSGLLIAFTAVVSINWLKISLFIIAIAGIVIIPNIYSYILFRRKTERQ